MTRVPAAITKAELKPTWALAGTTNDDWFAGHAPGTVQLARPPFTGALDLADGLYHGDYLLEPATDGGRADWSILHPETD
ncbi:MAG TPA: hypothetical protein VMW48_08835 [Vicinamibacterales bacterium]|nr:hypothetical protein [Vicinamibacterales bacterium]